jgi:hypothetical protein
MNKSFKGGLIALTVEYPPKGGVFGGGFEMEFYLGTHVLNHMEKTNVPLFISFRQLRKRKKKQFKQLGKIAVDSGGFTELSMFGKWTITEEEYIQELHRLIDLGLKIEWCSPMDWMVEDFMLEKTGLSVLEHQKKTVSNLIKLRSLTDKIHFIPVLQGQTIDDYFSHFEMYDLANIDLRKEKIVGVGSVCRRQNTNEIKSIMKALASKGINIHGFGVKSGGLEKYGNLIGSSDSLAWSYGARYSKKRCIKCRSMEKPTSKNCANCLEYALEWRQKLIDKLL